MATNFKTKDTVKVTDTKGRFAKGGLNDYAGAEGVIDSIDADPMTAYPFLVRLKSGRYVWLAENELIYEASPNDPPRDNAPALIVGVVAITIVVWMWAAFITSRSNIQDGHQIGPECPATVRTK